MSRKSVIKRETWCNVETGEVKELETVTKYSNSKNFWKVYLMDFLSILGVIDSKQLDVFIYVLEHTNKATNLFLGTYEKISQDLKVSKPTIVTIFKKLKEHDFIRQISPGCYFVNPRFLFVGGDNKANLMIKYVDEASCVEDVPPLKMNGEIKEFKKAN